MKALPRRTAYSPLSADWTLYNPNPLAEKLGITDINILDKALEETGYNKAVRIREDIIRWKTELLKEQKELHFKLQTINTQADQIKLRQYLIEVMLVNIRNILRIPRENPVARKGEK